MPQAKNTKTHNIFLIDKNKLFNAIDVGYPAVGRENVSTETAIMSLMGADDRYQIQTLKENVDMHGFFVKLFFRRDDNYQSKFSSFCKAFVEDDQPAVTFNPRSASSILFIWSEKNIYAITTGQGFRMVEDCSIPKFGLIIASVFEERFKVTSLDSNAMSSIIHSTKTVYSNEIDFIDIDALDTVFKEVTGRLKDADKVRSLLNLSADSKKKSMKITAKNHVQFSSALSFNGLLHLLTIIDEYDFENLSDRFNLITPISSKKHGSIIATNNDAVIAKIYEAIKANQDIPYDLFHKDTDTYISADEFTIYDSDAQYASVDDYGDHSIITTAYAEYLRENNDTQAAFNAFVKGTRLCAMKEENVATDAPLLNHISGEIQVSGINYYIFYGEYYRLNTAYTDRLNDTLQGKLRQQLYTQEIQTQWPQGKNEDWFNLETSTQEAYVHLHRVKPDNIEFADLLKYENDVVTVVHVKDGFDCDMRALDRQVELSITKIMDIKHHNNHTYLGNLYVNAVAHTTGKNISSVFSTKQAFLECMKNKAVRYVVVLRPANKDLLANQSNIAKHCLNALILRCFQQGIELKIQVL